MNKTGSKLLATGPHQIGLPLPAVYQKHQLQRIFLICRNATSDAIRNSFAGEEEFVACGEGASGIESLQRTAGPSPGLVILELEGFSLEEMEIVGALKLSMPEVPLFLVCEHCSMQSEKQAISYGIDAMFETKEELSSLVLNARALLHHACTASARAAGSWMKEAGTFRG
jgi:hypothetical protein